METSTQSRGQCATRPTSIGTAGRLGSESVADIMSECPADIVGIRTPPLPRCRHLPLRSRGAGPLEDNLSEVKAADVVR